MEPSPEPRETISRFEKLLAALDCRHLANAQILRRLEREARRAGRLLPQVCTPLELMGDYPYEDESAS